MESFVKNTSIAEMHKKLVWFDYNNLDNCESMTGSELLASEIVISYDKEEDICKAEFPKGGLLFDSFCYESGSSFDRQQIEDMKNLL